MPGPFTAAPHHDILILLVQLAALLLTARVFGEICLRLGQPSVVGEILAGIVLGPSLLSGLFPGLGAWLVPQEPVQGYLLEVVSLLGVLFLLLVTGLETDLALIRRQSRSALGIAAGGLALPLLMGFGLGLLTPEALLVSPDQRVVFALFLATALAISAIPVVAKVLLDLNLTRRDIGQALIAAAMIDDTIGWVLLSVVIGLAGGGVITLLSVGQSALSVVAFMGLSLTLGVRLLRPILSFVQGEAQSREKILSLVMLCVLIWGAIGQALNLEALLGAFVVGLMFSQLPRLNPDVIHKLESITVGFFAPIFFGIAGLKVNALSLLTVDLLPFTLVVIAVATLCKVIGVYAGARWIGRSDHWTAVFFGAGLNARGSMGIIVATIGLSLNVLTQEMFSMIVVMAVFTSLLAPAVMRAALTRIRPEPQEVERLKREALAKDSLIANVHRVLLPVRARAEGIGSAQRVEAALLDRIHAQSPLSLTLMTVTSDQAGRAAGQRFLDQLSAHFHQPAILRRVVRSAAPGDAILDELRKDYDLLLLGAPETRASTEVLFTPIIDYLMRLSPCPTLIVHGHDVPEHWTPRRIMVPTNGSMAARRAAEIAFALAGPAPMLNGARPADGEASVVILRVVEENRSSFRLDAGGMQVARHLNVAQRTVEQLRELGQMNGVEAIGEVRVGDEPETTILNIARADEIDLIVLGTSVHAGSERLYLGPRVERILNNAPCPVIIVNS